MSEEYQEIKNLIQKHQKDLTTKYNVLVKRTNSIITSLDNLNTKMDYLVERMSMFEFIDEDEDEDDLESYGIDPEEYEDDDDDGQGYD